MTLLLIWVFFNLEICYGVLAVSVAMSTLHDAVTTVCRHFNKGDVDIFISSISELITLTSFFCLAPEFRK